MIKRVFRLIIIGLLLCSLVYLNNYSSEHYTVMMPGITEDLGRLINVEEGNKDYQGKFLLTAVSSRQANLPMLIYSVVNRHARLIPDTNVIPPDWDRDQYYRYMQNWMSESQAVAKYVALNTMGYNPVLKGDGVEVTKLLDDSPAKNILFEGDIIKKVNGSKVEIAEELVERVQRTPIGNSIDLEVERNGKISNVTVNTYENTSIPGKAAIGVYIVTHNYKPHFPLDIIINTGEIVGPSAGLMFTLEIINQLTPEDITKGNIIAGTGTIGLDGSVGEIGGVDLKVISSKRDGASIFFSPIGNYEEAKNMGDEMKIRVIPVGTLKEALDFLATL